LLTRKQGNGFNPNEVHTYHSASQWLLAGSVNIATTRGFVRDFVIIRAKFRMLHCTPRYNLPHVPLHSIILQNTGVCRSIFLLILSRALRFEVLTTVTKKSSIFFGLHGVVSPKLKVFSPVLLLTLLGVLKFEVCRRPL
jgi:hypothetical protein